MTSISHVSPSTALRVITPVGSSRNAGRSGADDRFHTRQAYTTARSAHAAKPAFSADSAAFIAQAIANDNETTTIASQGAIAYLIARDRLSDLPVGFLIAKAV